MEERLWGWGDTMALQRWQGCPEDGGFHRGVVGRDGTRHPERWHWGMCREWVEVVRGTFETGRPLLGAGETWGVGADLGQSGRGGRGTGLGDCLAGLGGHGRRSFCQMLGGRAGWVDGDPLHQDRESEKEAGLQEKAAGSVLDRRRVSHWGTQCGQRDRTATWARTLPGWV